MDIQIIAALIGAVIGGFLAACAGSFVSWRSNLRQKDEMRDFFRKAIIEDLKNSIPVYEKIQEDWDKSSLIWFITLAEQKKSRKTYDKYDERLLLFDSDSIRRRISKYYLNSETIISNLEFQQNRKYQIDIIYNEIFRKKKLENQSIDDKSIDEYVRGIMKNEILELDLINIIIPKLVNKLDRMINEAQNIIDLLERF